MILGITGTDGAGKGAVVDYLVSSRGFIHCSARQLFIDEINRQGLPVDREHMRLVANGLRAQYGADFLVEEYKRRTGFLQEKNYIVESIRALAEVSALKKYGGILLAVDASPEIRFERITARGSESDNVSFETFMAHEALEMNDPDPHGMQKGEVIRGAHYTIMNNGTFEELRTEVDRVLREISER